MPAPSIHAFAEKVALITDGENPIGRAVALQLALQGAYVIVGFANSSEESTRAIEELKSLGTLANAVETDISTVEGAKKLVAEVEKMFGRIDLLVHTASFEPQLPFPETDEDIWQKTVDVNVKSFFFVMQSAFNLMSPRPKPSIVAVVSDSENGEKNPAFIAAQNAIIGLTKNLSHQLPKNFRANCVCVGEQTEDVDVSELFKTTKGVSSNDTARTVLYLLSSEAKSLNGQVLKLSIKK